MAGADEAGRGSLAGPLVAAGVLFDYERLTLREVRSLTRLDDSKVHDLEAREALYPLVMKAAARVSVTSRCVRGIDERGLHVTNLAALCGTASPGSRCRVPLPRGRLPRPATAATSRRPLSTATPAARRSPRRRSSPR